MLKNLLIFSHPVVRDPSSAAGKSRSDERRSVQTDLPDRWKRNAQRIGVWMQKHRLIPDQVRCAPTLMSRTAAEKACKTAGLNEEIVQDDVRLKRYTGSLLSEMLAETDSTSTCMLLAVDAKVALEISRQVAGVRHNDPEVAPLNTDDRLLHLEITVREIEAAASQVAVFGHLQESLDPSSLPKLFPYPDVFGSEQRPRPAYYYRQSAVIPFRYCDDELEVLVVSTSKGKRWVVPKGIHDPGKSAQESAANEAMEEAGVLGNVIDVEVGRYTHDKWGATCTVAVYPMEVTEVLDDDRWPESHRKREWLSVDAAADRVHQHELREMIRSLPEMLGERLSNESKPHGRG